MAIRYCNRDYSALNMQLLLSPNIIITASPQYIADMGAVDSLEDLHRHQLIHCIPPKPSQAETSLVWNNILPESVINTEKSFIVPEDHLAIEAAIHGHGLVLAEQILVSDALRNGQLQQVFPQTFPSSSAYYLVYAKGARASRLRDAFLAWLQQRLNEEIRFC